MVDRCSSGANKPGDLVMRKLVPLTKIIQDAEEKGLDPEDIVCDPQEVHVVERDDVIELEPEEEELE